MKDVSFLKKLKLFKEYRKILLENKRDLELNYGIKLDWVNRMYTVLNIPEEFFEEPYNIRKADIDKIAENYIKDYINALNAFLNSKGLGELFDFAQPITKVDKYSYLIVLGFSQLPNQKMYINTILYTLLSSGVIGLIIYLLHLKNIIF